MDAAVKIKDLLVTLGSTFPALDIMSLDLPASKIIGIIGPSGAGKTSLIKGIVGSFKLTQGEITVFNEPAGSVKLRKVITYMPQSVSVYSDLTVSENLDYFITVSGQPKKQKATIIADLLKAVDMVSKSDSLVSNLSGGQKQRVSLAIALIGSPKLIVLDEPTVGLDPVLRKQLWQLFAQLASSGTTVILSSHSMDEAARCDDIVLMRAGKIIAHSSPEDLLKQTASETIEDSFLKLVKELP